MRRFTYLILTILFAVPAFAQNPLFELSYVLLGAGRDNYDIVLGNGSRPGDNITLLKPAVGNGYSAAIWRDVTPFMATGIRYSRSRHFATSGVSLLPLSGLVTPRMNYHVSEGWRFGTRFFRPQHGQATAVYPFLSAGVDYTRTGWSVRNGLVGYRLSDEEMEEVSSQTAQWEVDLGGGLFFYRGKRARLAFEATVGLPVIYNEEPFLNGQLNMILGF